MKATPLSPVLQPSSAVFTGNTHIMEIDRTVSNGNTNIVVCFVHLGTVIHRFNYIAWQDAHCSSKRSTHSDPFLWCPYQLVTIENMKHKFHHTFERPNDPKTLGQRQKLLYIHVYVLLVHRYQILVHLTGHLGLEPCNQNWLYGPPPLPLADICMQSS